MLTRMLTRTELLVLSAVATGLVLGSVGLYFNNRSPAELAHADPAPRSELPVEAPVPEPAPAPESAGEAVPAPAAEMIVSVQGAVQRPGVYHMPAGARVQDIIDRAGGTTEHVVLDDINLAAPLIDGTTLTLPAQMPPEGRDAGWRLGYPRVTPVFNPPQYTVSGWQRAEPSDSAGTGRPGAREPARLININTATQDELETLPGIGPATARSILQYRESQPFHTVEQLMEVRGIGPAKLEAVKDLVTVR